MRPWPILPWQQPYNMVILLTVLKKKTVLSQLTLIHKNNNVIGDDIYIYIYISRNWKEAIYDLEKIKCSLTSNKRRLPRYSLAGASELPLTRSLHTTLLKGNVWQIKLYMR
jgi:hypothetical protein